MEYGIAVPPARVIAFVQRASQHGGAAAATVAARRSLLRARATGDLYGCSEWQTEHPTCVGSAPTFRITSCGVTRLQVAHTASIDEPTVTVGVIGRCLSPSSRLVIRNFIACTSSRSPRLAARRARHARFGAGHRRAVRCAVASLARRP